MSLPTVRETINLPGGTVPAGATVTLRLVALVGGHGVGYRLGAGVSVAWARTAEIDEETGLWSIDDVPPNFGDSDDVITQPADTVYEVVLHIPGAPKQRARHIRVPDEDGPIEVVTILHPGPDDLGIALGAAGTALATAELHSVDTASTNTQRGIEDLSADIATGWVPAATGAAYRRGLRAGIADMIRLVGALRLVGIGTSIMQGWSATAYALMWFTIVHQRLATLAGLTTIGRGLVGCGSGFGYDPGWTVVGTVTATNIGMKQWGAVLNVGASITQTFTTDRIIIHGCKQNFLRGAIEIRIDGVLGGPNAVSGDSLGKYQSYDGSLAATAYGAAWAWNSGPLTPGSHTVEIRQVTGTGGAFAGLVGEVMVFNGDYGVLEMWNAGHFGYSTAQYDTPTGSSIEWAEWLQFINPHAIVVCHGVNDYGDGSDASVAAFKARLQSTCDYIEAKTTRSPTIILCVDQLVAGRSAAAWAKFRLATYEVGRGCDADIFDFDQLCGPMGTTGEDAWGLMAGDQVHPADRGHSVMGHTLANWLEAYPRTSSGGGDPTMGGDLTGTASNAQIAAGAVGATEIADGSVGSAELGATAYSALVGAGLVAARPAFGTAGREYFATDVAGGTLYRDSGTAWVQIARGLTECLLLSGGTLTGQLVTPAGAAATPAILVGSGAGLFNPSTDRLSIAINNAGTLAERFRITVNQMLAFAGTTVLPSYAHNVDAGSGMQPGFARVDFSVTGAVIVSLLSTGLDMHSLKIVNLADATAATDGLNRQTGDARYPLRSTLTAKGSLWVASAASTPAEQTVGADGTTLIADASQSTGVRWAGWAPAIDFPASMIITMAVGSTLTANECHYFRSIGHGSHAYIGFQVTTSTGNVSVASYTNSGTGKSAQPTGGRLATSGSVACPSAGYAKVSLGATIVTRTGDWLGISSSGAPVVSGGAGAVELASDAGLGIHLKQTGTHPLPATPSSLSAVIGRHLLLVGDS